MSQDNKKVKFIRVRGRIVPIRDKKGSSKNSDRKQKDLDALVDTGKSQLTEGLAKASTGLGNISRSGDASVLKDVKSFQIKFDSLWKDSKSLRERGFMGKKKKK